MKKTAAVIGRPRAFDPDKALDAALLVFWKKGYEGASLSDLTSAMGINRPSLYAAFGNKEDLFRKALDRYSARAVACFSNALSRPTARAAIQSLLNGTADLFSDPLHPSGCLMVQGALACGQTADPIRKELIVRRAAGQAAIRQRLERAKSEGDLPRNCRPADLARYVTTVIHGMAVQATGGASRQELRRLAQIALQALPS